MHISNLLPAPCVDLYRNIQAIKEAKTSGQSQPQLETLALKVYIAARDCLGAALIIASSLLLPSYIHFPILIIGGCVNTALPLATLSILGSIGAVVGVTIGIAERSFSFFALSLVFQGVSYLGGSYYRHLILKKETEAQAKVMQAPLSIPSGDFNRGMISLTYSEIFKYDLRPALNKIIHWA